MAMKMKPSFVDLVFKLECSTTSSGMSLNLRRTYSLRLSGVIRKRNLISVVKNLAPGVDMTLFRSRFTLSMYDVDVNTSPGKLILSPPTTNRAW